MATMSILFLHGENKMKKENKEKNKKNIILIKILNAILVLTYLVCGTIYFFKEFYFSDIGFLEKMWYAMIYFGAGFALLKLGDLI
jgi:hypothetical protein